MPPSPEPLRRLPLAVRPFHRETVGSFLTRLAYANNLRVAHLLELVHIGHEQRYTFNPATDNNHGWSTSTPHRTATLSGRSLTSLAAAIPAIADALAPTRSATLHTKLLRACRCCTTTRNIPGMVIIRAEPHQYLCTRHRLWHHGTPDADLTALPQVVHAQRRHNRHVTGHPLAATARAHRQAREVIDSWFTDGWHPALTDRWQQRLHLLNGQPAGQQVDIATHPELLAVASLLLSTTHDHANLARHATSRLGFAYPQRPHPLDRLPRAASLPAAEQT